jgi:hypothetical protein
VSDRAADALVSTGLAAAGYRYVNLGALLPHSHTSLLIDCSFSFAILLLYCQILFNLSLVFSAFVFVNIKLTEYWCLN